MKAAVPDGLYVITSDALCQHLDTLLHGVEAALRGGAVLVQYRDKQASAVQRLTRARALRRLCDAHHCPLIINDDVALACEVGAAGVHIGQRDGAVATVRAQLGGSGWLGVSCGDDLGRARAAVAAGANYVAFGRLFPSRSKPDAPPARLTTLSAAADSLSVPVCAIGGITPPQVAIVRHHGARLVAVIDGVFGAPDIETAAQAYTDALATYNRALPSV